jgi:hypothetical protein
MRRMGESYLLRCIGIDTHTNSVMQAESKSLNCMLATGLCLTCICIRAEDHN